MTASIDRALFEQMFYVTHSGAPEPLFEVDLDRLAQGDGALQFVQAYAPEIKASTYDVAATYFASWAGRLCAAHYYALWHDGLDMRLTLRDVSLQLVRQQWGVGITFKLKEYEAVPVPLIGESVEQTMHSAIERFFGEVVRPIVDAVSEAGGVSSGSVWALMTGAYSYLLSQWRGQELDDTARERLGLLNTLLVEKVRPEVFGRPKNPFQAKPRMVENIQGTGQLVPLKGSCCLAYKTDTGHGYCFTCPKINEEERQGKREAFAAKA
jgi:hypothetical protein